MTMIGGPNALVSAHEAEMKKPVTTNSKGMFDLSVTESMKRSESNNQV